MTVLLAFVAAAVPATAAAQSPSVPSWEANVRAAARYAETRSAIESFALVDTRGRLHGRAVSRIYRSASVLKAMLLVAYLSRPPVRSRELTARERGLLAPMIRWSANEPATYLVRLLGRRALDRVAGRGGMRHFRLDARWGFSEITAQGQARFFRRIDRLVPSDTARTRAGSSPRSSPRSGG